MKKMLKLQSMAVRDNEDRHEGVHCSIYTCCHSTVLL